MPRIQYEAHLMNIFPSAMAPTGLTDELFNLIGDRAWNHCYEIEKAALGCLEYYGCKRGLTICADHYDDFHECMSREKQYLRAMAMMSKRRMRYREYLAGKRDYDKRNEVECVAHATLTTLRHVYGYTPIPI